MVLTMLGAALVTAVAWKALVWARVRQRAEVDANGVRLRAVGTVERVAWRELVEIRIETTGDGPWGEDLFWHFTQGDGGVCVLPGALVGSELMDRLAKIPGVDWEAVIASAGCVENASFVVWKGPPGAATGTT